MTIAFDAAKRRSSGTDDEGGRIHEVRTPPRYARSRDARHPADPAGDAVPMNHGVADNHEPARGAPKAVMSRARRYRALADARIDGVRSMCVHCNDPRRACRSMKLARGRLRPREVPHVERARHQSTLSSLESTAGTARSTFGALAGSHSRSSAIASRNAM